jgi:hypothetical protein
MVAGGAWVFEPFLHENWQEDLFGNWKHNDLLELTDSTLFSKREWQPAEASARFSVALALIVAGVVLVKSARLWRSSLRLEGKAVIPARVSRRKQLLLGLTVLAIGSAAYPTLLVRKELNLAEYEPVPPPLEMVQDFGKPPPLSELERSTVGKELSPDHPGHILLLTPAGLLWFKLDHCPVHEKPLNYERIPFHPNLPGHKVREGFPFGQLAFAQRIGVRLRDWGATRCADCVMLHQRFLGISEAELSYRAQQEPWGGKF